VHLLGFATKMSESNVVSKTGDHAHPRPDPTIQVPIVPSHLKAAHAFLEDSERGTTLLWRRANQTFQEVQAYLLQFVQEYAHMLMLYNCPVQTGLRAPATAGSSDDSAVVADDATRNHHEPGIMNLLGQLNEQLEVLRQVVENAQNQPLEALSALARARDLKMFGSSAEIATEAEARRERFVSEQRPPLPNLDAFRKAAEPHLAHPTFGRRVQWLARLFDTMLTEYRRLIQERREVHRVTNNAFVVKLKAVCQLIAESLDAQLVPTSHTFVQQRKQLEQTSLHKTFEQRCAAQQKEKSAFYTTVESWVDEQVSIGLVLLDLIQRIMPRREDKTTTVRDEAETTSTTPILMHLASVPPPPPQQQPRMSSTAPTGASMPTTDIFADLRSPLHTVTLDDAVFVELDSDMHRQHAYLKESLMISAEFFRASHRTDHVHVAVLPDMFQRLLRFVEFAQRLFVRALQHAQLLKTRSGLAVEITEKEATAQVLAHFLELEATNVHQQQRVAQAAVTTMRKAYQKCVETEQDTNRQLQQHFNGDAPNLNTARRVRFASTDEPSGSSQRRAEQLLVSVAESTTSKGNNHPVPPPNNNATAATNPSPILRQEDIREAIRLETLFQQKKHESVQCARKLDQVKRELRLFQGEAARYDQVIQFLNSFQLELVPQWKVLIERERDLIPRWSRLEQQHHNNFRHFRWNTAQEYDSRIFHAARDLCGQVEVVFADVFTQHLKWVEQLHALMTHRNPIIAESRQTVQSLNAQITLSLEGVSRQTSLLEAELLEAMLLNDIYDLHAYDREMKKVALTCRQLMIDLTTRMLGSARLRNLLVQLDHMCCHENRLGFGFPALSPLVREAKLAPASLAIATTRVEQLAMRHHQETVSLSDDERRQRDHQTATLMEMKRAMVPGSRRTPEELQ
jgi:hypothetical protein